MKKSLVEILACPECRSPLELSVFEQTAFKAEEIMSGAILCNQCPRAFPIIDGIPRFVPNVLGLFPEFAQKYPKFLELSKSQSAGSGAGNFAEVHGSTQERFGFEWMNYPGSLPEDKEIFLYETQIPEPEWKSKKVMDAGCGMGRYARVAHSLGAEVVAFDLSGALVRLWDVAKSSEHMHLVQANLMKPPLRENSFDIVYSVGVIHHTPSAKQTFGQISKLVRPGGKLSVWVYGAPGKFSNFKTNPLRADRQGLKKFIFGVWLIVTIREIISDTLRIFTVHFPHKLLYAFCYPLALLGKVPLIKYLTFSMHQLWRVRLQENFDWLSPPYQSHHTKEELAEWFKNNGYEPLTVLPHGVVPKPGIVGVRKSA